MSSNQTNHPSSDSRNQFPAKLLTLAILQILANSTQFTAIKPVSLSILTHVASRYLQLLGQSARENADYCGRNQINAWDISGILESLQGPGALSGLHNWCLDNLRQDEKFDQDVSNQQHPIEKLAAASRNLTEFNPIRQSDHITSLSFIPLTDSEVAALDRAGESDLEDDHASPLASTTSGSSEDDSDLDLPHFKPSPNQSSPSQLNHPSQLSLSINMEIDLPKAQEEVSKNLWRSVDDIPSYVPAYFPPFPGLERPTPIEENLPSVAEQTDVVMNEPQAEAVEGDVDISKVDPYQCAIPYSKSQLRELHGSFIVPNSVPFCNSSAKGNSISEGDLSLATNDSLHGFLQSYAYLIEEKMTNKLADDNRFMKRNRASHQLISNDQAMPLHDSLFGSISVASIRTNRWSAGWIPHPPTKAGKLLPIPELKPYGLTPLPPSVTMPVPIQFPSQSILNQPHPRIPNLIPRLFQKISQEARGDAFTLVTRLTRLGPPSALGESGEALPYQIKDIATPSATDPSSNPELNQPKYMEWGFHWPPHDGREPLPPPRPDFDFKSADFPAMPRTTAEKTKMAQKEKEEALLNQATIIN
ncbi:hypothetical protein O181_080524 [Austropuccinia psidii MF-1]|uniref:Bromodomain associated domain-containing protein n=1 Tax=Austropuccinia psidii MF-1 TaxID=1389203 RepID=A0A9Q3FKK1_9BASI|nr:hypothetical protein [Austropuccinia psidii MF-1]